MGRDIRKLRRSDEGIFGPDSHLCGRKQGVGLLRRLSSKPARLLDLRDQYLDAGHDPLLLIERREWDRDL
jgi:hypothetical protein